jgi:hypothetical protein
LERMESGDIFLVAYYLVKTLRPAQFWKKKESYNFFWKACYLFYLVQTPSWQIWTRKILERINSEFNSYVQNS